VLLLLDSPHCLFPSLVNETHNILDLAFIVNAFSFDHFVSQLTFVGLAVQPRKCLIWSLQASFMGSPFFMVFIAFPMTLRFYAYLLLMCFFSYLQAALNEDVHHTEVFMRLENVQVTLGMFY
jgi:hypothetical protein